MHLSPLAIFHSHRNIEVMRHQAQVSPPSNIARYLISSYFVRLCSIRLNRANLVGNQNEALSSPAFNSAFEIVASTISSCGGSANNNLIRLPFHHLRRSMFTLNAEHIQTIK